MKLACVRCKQKKIKCDKTEPVCNQCITAATECVYVERRKRPKLSEKHDVRELSRRIQFLEQQLAGNSSSPLSREQSVETVVAEPQPIPSRGAPKGGESGQESWIYRLASDTRQKFEKVNTQSGATTRFPNTPDSPNVDDAISALKEALDDLGKLKTRSEERVPRDQELMITTEEAKACVKGFREMMGTIVIPDLFVSDPNTEILEALPDLMGSPYITIDPALRVAYFNALYFGLNHSRGPGNPSARVAYYKFLEAVPAWLSADSSSELDGHCAALTTFTALHNFDYQLAYKFHARACHFLRVKGVDRLDAIPIRSNEEEDRRQSLRYLYWLCLQTDLLFRLLLDKPPMIRWKVGRVKPPTLFSTSHMAPTADQSRCYVVWIRFTVLTAEVMDVVEDREQRTTPEVMQKVDRYCSDLEELVADWNLIDLSNPSKAPKNLSMLYADHTINLYASIVGVRRLARPPADQQVDAVTLRAARMVIQIILGLNKSHAAVEDYVVFFHFISFYPFCAVFTLYEYILACTDPAECEQDIRSLEAIGSIMKRACEVRSDFNPLSNIITALNKVSRSLQESRQCHTQALAACSTETARSSNQQQAHNNVQSAGGLVPVPPTSDTAHQVTGAGTAPEAPAAFTGPLVSDFASLQDFSMNANGEMLPLDFIRTLENDFIGRNWHEGYWDMGTAMDVNMDLNPDATPQDGAPGGCS